MSNVKSLKMLPKIKSTGHLCLYCLFEKTWVFSENTGKSGEVDC